jgi:tRNA modification GTPase
LVNSLHIDQAKTICAIATPPGIGAIAMIRLSGPKAISITEKVFSQALKDQLGNTAVFGLIKDKEKTIDEVVLVIYRAPHSFTGEDSVEISCHASPFIQQEILRLLLENGASLASEGEFSLRAYLNGKMDLSQAEAIADIIASESEAAHRIAMNQMRGGYSKTIDDLRQELLNFASLIELELDFSEEDVEFADRTQLFELVNRILDMIQGLAGSFKLGNVIKNGVPVAIVGEPNVGKSTLLNALLNEDRAIVSEIAGTTRDTIEDQLVIEGIQFRFIDTAGIRNTTDTIESMGIERSLAKVDDASIILCMVDASKDDREAIEQEVNYIADRISGKSKRLIVVANKSDLATEKDHQKFDSIKDRFHVIYLSAKENEGISELKSDLSGFVNSDPASQQQVIVSNARHYEALKKAEESLYRVKEALDSQIPGDLVAMDIRTAIYHLGEITGAISSDDLLGNIFSKFCIGK